MASKARVAAYRYYVFHKVFESFKLKMPCRAGVAFLLSDE